MHWADEATLDFLRYLGRRVETVPTLVVATYRDDEVGVDHPLAVTLGDLSSAAGVERLHVVPLTVDGVRRLAEAAGSSLDPQLLHERTEGNPFYVTEVLAADGSSVPVTVRDAVLARTSRLTEGARGVLAATAVLGQPAELSLLSAVSGCPDSAVDECVVAGLLVGDGRRWGFRHELARLSVAGDAAAHAALDPARRRAEVAGGRGWGGPPPARLPRRRLRRQRRRPAARGPGGGTVGTARVPIARPPSCTGSPCATTRPATPSARGCAPRCPTSAT